MSTVVTWQRRLKCHGTTFVRSTLAHELYKIERKNEKLFSFQQERRNILKYNVSTTRFAVYLNNFVLIGQAIKQTLEFNFYFTGLFD